MNNKFIVIVLSILVIALVACDSRKKQEEKADLQLKQIEQLIQQNALNAAKIQIDSFHLQFPRLVSKRRLAAAFEDTIIRRESARTLAYCDSILPIKTKEVDSIQKSFVFEKNEKYQELGNFIYKTQRVEQNTNRSYLRAYVDENANIYLESTYTGSKIEHYKVIVSAADMQATTDSVAINNGANHSFVDGGQRWETVTFKNKAENGVVAFIAQFSGSPLKVTLLGEKSASYLLLENDKKAIAETYHLWVVKRDVAKLQNEIIKAKVKIERINASKK